MAAVTAANREDTVWGNKRVVIADLSSVDDADTWATGLQKIDAFHFTPQTAVATGATFSGGTVTFAVAAGTLAGKALAIGT
jgi:hypothetical protein